MKILARLYIALVAILLAACGSPSEPHDAVDGETGTARARLSRGVVVDDGTLSIGGDDTANEIHITYSREGIHVDFDGQENLFREPIRKVAVDAGHGNNVVSYRQSIVADIALGIFSGDGDDVLDVDFDLVDPPDGRIPTFAVDVDSGGGSGRVKVQFSWITDEADPQFDFAADVRPGERSRFTPEIGDEVVVGVAYGDPDRPIIVGAVHNSSGGAPGTGQPRLGLRNLARALSATTEVHFTGGHGDDDLDLNVDYSGVRLQQGRLILDADFNEGDNRFGGYIVTSARHMHVSSALTAGDGDNDLELRAENAGHGASSTAVHLSKAVVGNGNNEMRFDDRGYDEIQADHRAGNGDNLLEETTGGSSAGPVKAAYDLKVNKSHLHFGDGDNRVSVDTAGYDAVDLLVAYGDGDNHTDLRFGDGVLGRRPPAAAAPRTIKTTYRSGTGSDTIVIDGEAKHPVAAELVIDPGGENNTLRGRYTFGDGPSPAPPARPRSAASQLQVQLLAPFDELGLRVEEPADAPGKPAEFVIIAVGQKTSGTFEYLKTAGVAGASAGSDAEFKYVPIRRTFTLQGLQVDGVFGAKTRSGAAAFDLKLAGATVGSMDWTDWNDHDPGKSRAAMAVDLSDVRVSGRCDLSLERGNPHALVSYTQDRVVIEPGAAMDVRLDGSDGPDALLALLRGITTFGDGSYRFTADGGADNDLIAVLARDLDPGARRSMSFEVLGGEGNDTLALALLADPARTGTTSGRVDGGPGFDRCFVTPGVETENCDRHLDGKDILRELRRQTAPVNAMDGVNSKEYTDEWSTSI
jgi:hypothetical protein